MTTTHTSAIVTPVVSAQSLGAEAFAMPTEAASARRHTVATNIEGLKLELQKIHVPSASSVGLKSNIEQGLQAIFSISSAAQTVTTPAHSNVYAHTHQLSSTPLLNTPTESCGPIASKSPLLPLVLSTGIKQDIVGKFI